MVFNAWINPASFAAWFGGPDTEIPLDSCSIDARAGAGWMVFFDTMESAFSAST